MLAPVDSDYIFDESVTPLLDVIKKYLPIPAARQAVPLPGTETDGYSAIYRSEAYPEHLKKYLFKDLQTTSAWFDATVRQKGTSPCMKYRPYDYKTQTSANYYNTLSYNDVNKMKHNLGAGLIYHLQNNPYKDSSKYESHRKIDNHIQDFASYDHKNHSFIVTLYSSNRYEWLLSDLACASYSITNTSLYDTLGANTSEYILQLTESPIILASKKHLKLLVALKKQFPDTLGHLISLVSMDPLFESDMELRKMCIQNNIALHDFNQIMALGEIFPLNTLPPTEKTLYTISFTSGTTGANPKGVSLTHMNAVGSLTFLMTQMPPTPNCLSFLPFAHIFERASVFVSFAFGACVILPQLNYSPLTLIDDLKLAKPSRISLVPRILNKFEAAIKSATIDNPDASAFKKTVFNKVFNDKLAAQSVVDGAEGKSFLYDKVVAKKIKSQFGFDNLEFVVVGSAPIDPKTIAFLKAALQIGISQGYGTTEIFAGFCLSPLFEAQPGSSGACSCNTELKLRELPDMNYTVKDKGGPRGEVLLKGYQVFAEYYKNPEETAETIDKDGWYHTGDIGQISSETGRLYIIDRVKNFFKLAQGEFIAPESIENSYLSNNPTLAAIFVHGDPLKNYLIGILGIDKPSMIAFLTRICKIKGANKMSDEELLLTINQKANKGILVETMNKAVPKLKGFQKVKNVFVEFDPFTPERNVVTPTMKVKRPMAKKFFAQTLQDLYEEGPVVADSKL